MSTLRSFTKKARVSKYPSRQVITEHRDILNSLPILAPILAKYDAGNSLPTPTMLALLHEIDKNGLVKDLAPTKVSASLRERLKIANRKIDIALGLNPETEEDKEETIGSVRSSEAKRYTVIFKRLPVSYTNDLVKIHEDVLSGAKAINKFEKKAHTYSEALGIADRTLCNHTPSNTFAEIVSDEGPEKKPIVTRVYRGASMERMLKKKLGPSSKNMVKYSAPLGNSMRTHETRSSFSRG